MGWVQWNSRISLILSRVSDSESSRLSSERRSATIRYVRFRCLARRLVLRLSPVSNLDIPNTRFCRFRPSALLASGFYCSPAPEQQRITACRRSAPPLHSVSLRCSVARTLRKRLTSSPFCFARMRVAFGIFRSTRTAPCFGHIRPSAGRRLHFHVMRNGGTKNETKSHHHFLCCPSDRFL